jgi:hypothetical protein
MELIIHHIRFCHDINSLSVTTDSFHKISLLKELVSLVFEVKATSVVVLVWRPHSDYSSGCSHWEGVRSEGEREEGYLYETF